MCQKFPDKDVEIVMNQTNVTERWAIWALQLHDGKISYAIIELTKNEEIIKIMNNESELDSDLNLEDEEEHEEEHEEEDVEVDLVD